MTTELSPDLARALGPDLPADPRVRWARVLRMEWVKMRSLRSTWLTLGGAVLAVVVIGTVVGYATNAHWSNVSPQERAGFDPISRSLGGSFSLSKDYQGRACFARRRARSRIGGVRSSASSRARTLRSGLSPVPRRARNWVV